MQYYLTLKKVFDPLSKEKSCPIHIPNYKMTVDALHFLLLLSGQHFFSLIIAKILSEYD